MGLSTSIVHRNTIAALGQNANWGIMKANKSRGITFFFSLLTCVAITATGSIPHALAEEGTQGLEVLSSKQGTDLQLNDESGHALLTVDESNVDKDVDGLITIQPEDTGLLTEDESAANGDVTSQVEVAADQGDATSELPNGVVGLTAQAQTAPVVEYKTSVQRYGWQKWVKNGTISGTSGKALRVEALAIRLSKLLYSGSIRYRSYVQGTGWQGWTSNGTKSGTTGKSLRMEAIKIALTGSMKEHYDVWYRVHAQKYGWMGWAKNGATAGTTGLSYRAEALQVVLVKKGGKAPGATFKNAKRATKAAYKRKATQSATYESVYGGVLRQWHSTAVSGYVDVLSKYRYFLFDINKDGIKELIVGNRGVGSVFGDVYTVKRKNGKLVAARLDSIDTGFRNTFKSRKGILYYWHNMPPVEGYPNFFGYRVTLKGGKVHMKLIDSYRTGQSSPKVNTGSAVTEYNVYTYGQSSSIDYRGLSGKATVTYVA
jgi:uncharacterized protein YjdB